MSRTIAEVKEVQVIYGGRRVLAVERLAVHRREILTLVGPNGAGKSTLLRVLGLLERPTHGGVWFAGEHVLHQPRRLLQLRRRLAVLLQDSPLFRMSVYDNVALGLRFRGLPAGEIDRRVNRWLGQLGIAHLKDRPGLSLSGGEAQRTSLARALVLEPELLLLDEPFGALDPPTREGLLSDLKGILAETETATFFVTHDRNEAMALGDRVAVMIGGVIRQLDTPERIFSAPLTEEVARFVGVETILPGRVISAEGGRVVLECNGWKLEASGEASPGEGLLVCLRPEDVTLESAGVVPPGTRNCLEGRVVRAIQLGPSYRVVLDCGIPIVALISKRSFRRLDLREGTRVVAMFERGAPHLIKTP